MHQLPASPALPALCVIWLFVGDLHCVWVAVRANPDYTIELRSEALKPKEIKNFVR